jgi:hypothetical protein
MELGKTYCLVCKLVTKNEQVTIGQTVTGRHICSSLCGNCGKKKIRFMKAPLTEKKEKKKKQKKNKQENNSEEDDSTESDSVE